MDLGLQDTTRQVVIIGSGPAGLTAAIYAARAALNPLVLAGTYWGGQLILTSDVENFPGYPNGVLGPDMMDELRTQAERFGAEVRTVDVTRVDFSRRPFVVATDEETITANSVIIATGAAAKRLEVPGETEMFGRGVSTCATCDGWFYRDKEIAVIGGGDSALEEALFLTRFANKVTVVHRRDALRASKVLQQRAQENPKIAFQWNAIVEEIPAGERVTGLRLRDAVSGEESTLPADGVFIAVGHQPNTELFVARSTSTPPATSPGSPATRRRPISPASSPPATCATTATGRRSRPPATAARRQWTRSAGWRSRASPCQTWRRRSTACPGCDDPVRSPGAIRGGQGHYILGAEGHGQAPIARHNLP